jgi:hypothetical protein
MNMRKQLIRVAPRQTAKVMAVLWFLFTLPFVLLMSLVFMKAHGPKPPVGFVLLMPVFYAVFGYIFTLIGAWLYNVVAKRVGGIEFTTEEVAETGP